MSLHNRIPSISAARTSPTEQEWDSHKELIKQIYITQDMRLKDLMATMRTEYGFYATSKMYKTHLAKWHFAKNNNLKDMKAVARRITEANVDDTEQRYEVNCRAVTAEEVARYFRRKGIKRLEDAVERDTPTNPRSPAEENFGPVCGAATQVSDVQQNSEQPQMPSVGEQGAIGSTVTATLSKGLLPTFSAQATFNSANELVLKMVAVYYTGCCESNLWYNCTSGRFRTRRPVFDAATVLDGFVGAWTISLDLAKNGTMLNYYDTLSQACDKLPRIVQAEHPSTIRALLEMVLEYAKAGLCTLAVPVLKEVVRISPSNHPLAIICRQILRVEPSAAESMALAALACAANTLAKQCGEYHYCVIRCRTALIASESTYLNGSQVTELANRLLADFALSNQFSVEGYLNICESLLENLYDSWPLEEAEAMIERMKRYALDLCPERTRRWMVNCVDLLSKVQFSQGQFELAEQNCRLYIQERVADFGVGDSRVQACISRLIEWLCIWNRFDEALEVRARGVIGLAQFGDT